MPQYPMEGKNGPGKITIIRRLLVEDKTKVNIKYRVQIKTDNKLRTYMMSRTQTKTKTSQYRIGRYQGRHQTEVQPRKESQ